MAARRRASPPPNTLVDAARRQSRIDSLACRCVRATVIIRSCLRSLGPCQEIRQGSSNCPLICDEGSQSCDRPRLRGDRQSERNPRGVHFLDTISHTGKSAEARTVLRIGRVQIRRLRASRIEPRNRGRTRTHGYRNLQSM